MIKDMNDRIRGALYGVACGDALGAPLEFMSAEGIGRNHGYVREMIGGGWLNVKPGEVTDDTQMTLAVARGIVEQPNDPVPAVGREFIKWYNGRPKDVGATCSMSISKAMSIAENEANPSAENWIDAATITDRAMYGKSAGNGSLMRTVYVGLYYSKGMEMFVHAGNISQMTHYDSVAAQDCQAYSIMISRMVKEPNLRIRFDIIPNVLGAMQSCGERYAVYELAGEGYKPKPTGYVVDSFAAALHCILTTKGFEDAVAKAVNLGGDADTIGAITGGLAGALYGYEAIPERWVNTLDPDVRKELDELSEAAEAARKEVTP